jgi:hypothetical protein
LASTSRQRPASRHPANQPHFALVTTTNFKLRSRPWFGSNKPDGNGENKMKQTSHSVQILELHARGSKPEQIAQALSIPLREVKEVIGTDKKDKSHRRDIIEVRRLLVDSAIDMAARSKIHSKDAKLLDRYAEVIIEYKDPQQFDMALRQLLILK